MLNLKLYCGRDGRSSRKSMRTKLISYVTFKMNGLQKLVREAFVVFCFPPFVPLQDKIVFINKQNYGLLSFFIHLSSR
jgi:hypothetical protein